MEFDKIHSKADEIFLDSKIQNNASLVVYFLSTVKSTVGHFMSFYHEKDKT